MSAIVTDQFRILNANNFVDSAVNTANSYYVFVGLPNPSPKSIGFGRENDWDSNIPDPIDNIQYLNHCRDTSIFGKKITSSNIRRVIKRIDWTANVKYEMYRHDYSRSNTAKVSGASNLYSSAIKRLKEIPEIVESHYTTGNYAIFIKIMCKNNEDLMHLLNKDIQNIKGVSRTETFISLDQQIDRQITI